MSTQPDATERTTYQVWASWSAMSKPSPLMSFETLGDAAEYLNIARRRWSRVVHPPASSGIRRRRLSTTYVEDPPEVIIQHPVRTSEETT